MERRAFIKNTGMLGMTTLLPLHSCTSKPQPRFKMGLQLFSINDDMNNDPIGTLKKVKDMGYEDFEIYGFDPKKVTYYGIDAAEFKRVLDDMELSVTSGHYGFSDYFEKSEDEIRRFVDQCIQGADALNSPYITWPWVHPDHRNMNSYRRMPDLLNRIGQQITDAGLGFAYHNHGYEFDDHNGENGYEVIIHNTDPELVKLQIDMYWVMHSSQKTPKDWIDIQPGRFVMWHIKDMDKVTRDYTELGNGSIDYLNIMPDPDKSGLEYYYVEQGGNFAQSPLQSAATSAKHLK